MSKPQKNAGLQMRFPERWMFGTRSFYFSHLLQTTVAELASFFQQDTQEFSLFEQLTTLARIKVSIRLCQRALAVLCMELWVLGCPL